MKFFKIAQWEFSQRVKSKWFIFSLVFPLLIMGVSFLPALLIQKNVEVKTFALIDQTGWTGDSLMADFSQKYVRDDHRPQYEWIPLAGQNMSSPKAAADSMLARNVIDGYIIIPGNILESRKAEYYGESVGNFNDQLRLSQTLSNIVARREMAMHHLDPSLIENLTRDVNLATFEVRGGKTQQGNEVMAFAGPYFFVFILFMAIFMTSQILMRSVLEERQNRLVELLVSSAGSNHLMSGKILGIGAMGLLQVIIYLVVAQVVATYFHVNLITVGGIAGFLLYFIPGYLLYASFYAAVGSLFTSEQEAQQAVGVISLVGVVPLIFVPFAMTNPGSILVQILSYIPPITPFFMILRMHLGVIPFWEYALSFILLVSFTYLTIRIAGKLFNTVILMYGKRPSLPEIVRWIRA